jgi:hypothetical protein
VRSQEKADRIAKANSKYGKDKLDFAIVPDIAQEDAFEEAIKSDPPFEAVVRDLLILLRFSIDTIPNTQ